MARIKVRPNPTYLKIDESIKDTKYLQPSKEHLHYGSHLYILPSEIAKLQSPKCNIILVEGEKKTLKVIQEIRKIESQIGKFAVIGISGIHNWLHAPEWSLFNIRGKKVIIFFDADSINNTAVVEAEIQLTGYLYFQGASQVSSARWHIQKGKGIDDYLVQEINPPETLKSLIENAEDTIKMYKEAKRIQDRDIVRNFFLRIFEKKPNANTEHLTGFLQDAGIKKSIIQSTIKSVKIEIEEMLIEKYQERIKEVFGVENIQVPSDFLWEDGFLKTKKGKIITEFFIVKSIVEGIDDVEGVIIKTIRGKEIYLSNQEKDIKQLFLRHGVWVGDITLPLIPEYVKEYTYLNQANIETVKIAKQIGWYEDKDGNLFYIAPQTTDKYIFDPSLQNYTASGNKDIEKETAKKILRNGSILGLGYLAAVSSLLVKPLEKVGAKSFAVFLEGTAGAGKTTTGMFGLSIFGNPSELLTNMNTTTVGAEILFSTRKDSLIILDEINTAGYHYTEQVLKMIYDFDSGKGRTRSTVKLEMRKHHTYRGVVLFTSETSFSHILSRADKTVFGAYRRSVIVNFSGKDIKEDIQAIYDTIYLHHGNLLRDIIEHISNNIDFLKGKYTEYRKQLSIYKFKGQENHFALLYLSIHILEDILGAELTELATTLHQLVIENSEEYQEKTEMTKEKLLQSIQDFILAKISHFPTGMETHIPQSIFGKREKNTLYITQLGLEQLSEHLKIDIKSLKKYLIDFGMAERGEDRLLKKTMFSIGGENFYAYKIQLLKVAENQDNQDTNQETIDI
jgi:hypothetical protein